MAVALGEQAVVRKNLCKLDGEPHRVHEYGGGLVLNERPRLQIHDTKLQERSPRRGSSC